MRMVDADEICNKCQYHGEKFVCEMCKVFNAPTYEEKSGVWQIKFDSEGMYGTCSVCELDTEMSVFGRKDEYLFCPRCGSKMRWKDGTD